MQAVHDAYARGQRRGISSSIVISMAAVLVTLLYMDGTLTQIEDGMVLALPPIAIVGYIMYLTVRHPIKRSAPHA